MEASEKSGKGKTDLKEAEVREEKKTASDKSFICIPLDTVNISQMTMTLTNCHKTL